MEEPSESAWLINLKEPKNLTLCELDPGHHTVEQTGLLALRTGESRQQRGTCPQRICDITLNDGCSNGVQVVLPDAILCVLSFQIAHLESGCVG